MKKQTFVIAAIIVLLLGIAAFLEWMKLGEVRAVYGITISFRDDQQRSFTWLSSSLYENSVLQIKPKEAEWEKDSTEVTAEISFLRNESGNNLYTYRAELEGLEWGKSYNYRIAANGKVISDEYTFTVAQQKQDSFQFIHVTDTQGKDKGDYEQWGNVLRQAINYAPSAQFIVHGGDITDNASNEQEWKWFYQNASMLSSIPLLSTIGNHELVNHEPNYYLAHVTLPKNGSKGIPMHTSYYTHYQNLLFISVNTEADISAQTLWLKEVLEKEAERNTWVIVSMHRGLYGASQLQEAKEWEELFNEFHVDLVLQGHNHSYSRSYPLRDGKIVDSGEQGTVYITLNAAGSKLNEEKKEKKYQAVAFQNGKSMFGIVDVQQQRLVYSAYDLEGMLLDQVIIDNE